MDSYYLTQINIYPVKSLGGISLTSAYAGERGLQYDRRWMLVDASNRFITQRENPIMAQIGIRLSESGFSLFHKIKPEIVFELPFAIDSGKNITVTIWDDECDAIFFEDEINKWLRKVLQQDCQLVYMPDSTKRLVNEHYNLNNSDFSFADGFPFLIIGEASLQNLNEKLSLPVPMNRFRPNFVFSGGNAFDEDQWNKCSIGDVVFLAAKPCERCVITTTDQDTGARTAEPLRTLSEFRKVNNKVLFGQNLLVENEGIVKLYDMITVF